MRSSNNGITVEKLNQEVWAAQRKLNEIKDKYENEGRKNEKNDYFSKHLGGRESTIMGMDVSNPRKFTTLKTVHEFLCKSLEDHSLLAHIYNSTRMTCNLYSMYDVMYTLVEFIEYMYANYKRYFEVSRMQIYVAYKDLIKHSIDSETKENLMKFDFNDHIPKPLEASTMAKYVIELMNLYFQARKIKQIKQKGVYRAEWQRNQL